MNTLLNLLPNLTDLVITIAGIDTTLFCISNLLFISIVDALTSKRLQDENR